VAEVVRNLPIRQVESHLSAAEMTVLSNARCVLVSELSFALTVSDEEAGRRLDVAMA
jgi:CarD family transcriptional regulator